MNVAWVLVNPPTVEPIEIADAKLHLRQPESDEDSVIARMVKGVRSQGESYLGRGLLTQTWRYTQDVWSDVIKLPMAAPLQTVVVKYYDAAGVLQTLSSSVYQLDADAEPGVVRRKPLQVWPALQAGRPKAVEITYVVGWTTVADIPGAILDGLYLLLTRRYERRGDDAPQNAGVLDCPAAEACLAGHRVWWSPPVCSAT